METRRHGDKGTRGQLAAGSRQPSLMRNAEWEKRGNGQTRRTQELKRLKGRGQG